MLDLFSADDRLVVLAAADALDKVGNKAARTQITAAKVYVPNVVLRVLDAAMQVRSLQLDSVECSQFRQRQLARQDHPGGKKGIRMQHIMSMPPSCSTR